MISGLSECATKTIMTKVLSAVEFMHSENFVHRNLKAENILIFDEKDLNRVDYSYSYVFVFFLY